MQRLDKAKDARRRAHLRSKKLRALGITGATDTKIVPDRREKLRKKAETKDDYRY